jgi:hypothetical protein
MPRPPPSSRFDHPNNIWWWVQIMTIFSTLHFSRRFFTQERSVRPLHNNVTMPPLMLLLVPTDGWQSFSRGVPQTAP